MAAAAAAAATEDEEAAVATAAMGLSRAMCIINLVSNPCLNGDNTTDYMTAEQLVFLPISLFEKLFFCFISEREMLNPANDSMMIRASLTQTHTFFFQWAVSCTQILFVDWLLAGNNMAATTQKRGPTAWRLLFFIYIYILFYSAWCEARMSSCPVGWLVVFPTHKRETKRKKEREKIPYIYFPSLPHGS